MQYNHNTHSEKHENVSECLQMFNLKIIPEDKIEHFKYSLLSSKIWVQPFWVNNGFIPMWSVDFYLTGKNNKKPVVPGP